MKLLPLLVIKQCSGHRMYTDSHFSLSLLHLLMWHHAVLPQFILTVQNSIKINNASTSLTKRSLHHKDSLQKPSIYYSVSCLYEIYMWPNCRLNVLCFFYLLSIKSREYWCIPAGLLPTYQKLEIQNIYRTKKKTDRGVSGKQSICTGPVFGPHFIIKKIYLQNYEKQPVESTFG